ncbi:DUF2213 domain-containing protein [Pseudomonas sp. dw_358]|uniref:DUF2213 domain-containing protein n=1 Tax=Pseudomonas sp. dw_358 TaxID=2720083 RepID=UPI001BD555D4|nr:DUF2213 domain-containing protein [Pseudomonas sp. dw_358]
MKLKVQDKTATLGSRREFTDNGYLKVPGRVARVGVQNYLAMEFDFAAINKQFGLTLKATDVMRVYRPPESVFDPVSLASYDNADITLEHPGDFVGAENYSSHSVGHCISAGRQDGDFVEVDLLIKDGMAIKSVDSGKAELSAGYEADYDYQPGRTPFGEAYDFIQSGIGVNHVAICDKARAGHGARIFDSQKEHEMPKVKLFDGATVEVADENTQTIIQRAIDSLAGTLATEQARADGAEAIRDSLTGELTALKAKASDSALSERVLLVLDARSSANRLAGKAFTTDSVDPVAIKAAALEAVGVKCLKSEKWADAPAAYIEAFFDAQMANKDEDDQKDEDDKQKTKDSITGLAADLANAKPKGNATAQQTRDADYQAFLDKRYAAQEAK